MSFPKFFFLLLVLSVTTPLWADFGNWFVADQRLEIRLDSPNQKLSFRFTCSDDMTLTDASVYCTAAQAPPAFWVTLEADDHGHPSGERLSSQSFLPAAGRWLTVPLDHLPLQKGRTYHLVLEPDLNRGGEHPVGRIDDGHFASFGVTAPLNHRHPDDGSPDPAANALILERDHWKELDQQPLYVLYGLGDRLQGNAYDDPGVRPIAGTNATGDKTRALWQGQALHFHCGFQAKALAVRVRKKGHPTAPLKFVILKNEFRIHRCVPMAEGVALDPGQAPSRFQWVTIGFNGLAAANFSPECWFLALKTDSGRASTDGKDCEDCYQLSDLGNSGGLARASNLTFDGGPHLSRAVGNDQAGAELQWRDDFERDSNVAVLGPVCPEVPPVKIRPIPTPIPLKDARGGLR